MRNHLRRTGLTALLLTFAHVSIAHAQSKTPAQDTAVSPSAASTPTVNAPAEPPPATPAPTAPVKANTTIELTSLRLMRDKGVISEAEYQSAIRDVGDSTGALAKEGTTVAVGKWATTIYGFVEADYIYDNTQSFNESAGNAQVTRVGKYEGTADRSMFSIRNSRFGLREKAPEYNGIRVAGQLEFDFLGNQPQTTYSGQTSTGGSLSEASYFTNPTLRARHINLKVETSVVDILFGQYWALFGWQSLYHPNTVEIQGVPGQLYSRTPQLRIAKSIKTDPVTIEAAIAALRPPQRNSAYPEGQAGLRLAINDWTGIQTTGATATAVQPASIAVTGDMKNIRFTDFPSGPTTTDKVSTAIAVDAFIPVLPSHDRHRQSLSLNGEFVTGYGTSDQYTGLTGGVTTNPAVPNPAMKTPAPTYNQDFDTGVAAIDAGGAPHYIQWTSYLIGAQYYLPGLDGKVWVAANYSHIQSSNSENFGSSSRKFETWFDGNVFFEPTPALRFGVEGANFYDRYNDGTHASNIRVQGSAFLLF